MPYTVEDFLREQMEQILDETPHQGLLRRLTPQERVEGLSPEVLEAILKRMKSGQS